MGLRMVALGYRPFDSLESMPWMPKSRYRVMRETLGPKGRFALNMMLMTATGQVSLDFSDEADCARKVELVSRISPFLVAMYANSPLVKTALHGADPNWGRIVSAAGYAGVPFDPSGVTLRLNGFLLYEKGAPVPFDGKAVSQSIRDNRDTLIQLDFSDGTATRRFWTTDLTAEYVRLNADYHT